MQSKKKELRVDRIEEGLAIAYDVEGNEYCMCAKIADLQESDILVADINNNGVVFNVSVQRDKTEENKERLLARLQELSKRKGDE